MAQQNILAQQEVDLLQQQVSSLQAKKRDEQNLYLAERHEQLASVNSKLVAAKYALDQASDQLAQLRFAAPLRSSQSRIF